MAPRTARAGKARKVRLHQARSYDRVRTGYVFVLPLRRIRRLVARPSDGARRFTSDAVVWETDMANLAFQATAMQVVIKPRTRAPGRDVLCHTPPHLTVARDVLGFTLNDSVLRQRSSNAPRMHGHMRTEVGMKGYNRPFTGSSGKRLSTIVQPEVATDNDYDALTALRTMRMEAH